MKDNDDNWMYLIRKLQHITAGFRIFDCTGAFDCLGWCHLLIICCFTYHTFGVLQRWYLWLQRIQESLANAREARDSRVCMKTCFRHLNVVWRPLAEERLAISTQYIQRWKVHLVGYNTVADNMGLSSFVKLLLPLKHAKCGEIPWEFDLTAVQGHPRSSILVSVESPYVTSY